RRRVAQRPEGRWALLPWSGVPSPEMQAVLLASRLLHRYGIAARELALLDPWMPPWRVLYEVLSRMELSGEVRRGYFAEGLSGGHRRRSRLFAVVVPGKRQRAASADRRGMERPAGDDDGGPRTARSGGFCPRLSGDDAVCCLALTCSLSTRALMKSTFLPILM